MNNVLTNRLSPLIKYPGGKEKELNYIIPALPKEIDNYYELEQLDSSYRIKE